MSAKYLIFTHIKLHMSKLFNLLPLLGDSCPRNTYLGDMNQCLNAQCKLMDATITKDIHTEMGRISERLTHRIKELAERYEMPLPVQAGAVADLEKAVQAHLVKMGFVWN